jgi:hypothetical protein
MGGKGLTLGPGGNYHLLNPMASSAEVARQKGRRAAVVVFSALVTGFIVVCSIQILVQVWAPEVTSTELDCRPGAAKLLDAVRRARTAAATTTGGEREALSRFRAALAPEWTWRAALEDRCTGDPTGRKALREIDRFRYADEHAVRYDATSLSRLRQRMKTLENELHASE